jgi:uncharacterized protein (DUF3084 family)
MPVDERIDSVRDTLNAIKADDAAEDAAYEQQIANLTSQVANLTQLLATVTAERDQLANEKTATIADLIATRYALQTQLASLDARITALGG